MIESYEDCVVCIVYELVSRVWEEFRSGRSEVWIQCDNYDSYHIRRIAA